MNKIKNDPVEFAEKYLGVELTKWQKCYLRLLKKQQRINMLGRRGNLHRIWVNKEEN
jgi:hypothetical protein